MNRRLGFLSALVLVAVAGTGCGTFRHDWQKVRLAPVPTDDLTGAWEGTWQNSNNTHQDRMRAIVTRVGPETYHARFFAWYQRFLTFSYATDLKVERREGETVYFRGSSNLGIFAGGVYRYEGNASPTQFYSTYDSKYDVGTFTLQRPK